MLCLYAENQVIYTQAKYFIPSFAWWRNIPTNTTWSNIFFVVKPTLAFASLFFQTIIIMSLFMRISRTHFSGLALFIISHINLSTVLLINLCSFFLLEKHWNFTLSTVDDFWIPRRTSIHATCGALYVLSSFFIVNDNVIPSIQVWSFPDFYSGGKYLRIFNFKPYTPWQG